MSPAETAAASPATSVRPEIKCAAATRQPDGRRTAARRVAGPKAKTRSSDESRAKVNLYKNVVKNASWRHAAGCPGPPHSPEQRIRAARHTSVTGRIVEPACRQPRRAVDAAYPGASAYADDRARGRTGSALHGVADGTTRPGRWPGTGRLRVVACGPGGSIRTTRSCTSARPRTITRRRRAPRPAPDSGASSSRSPAPPAPPTSMGAADRRPDGRQHRRDQSVPVQPLRRQSSTRSTGRDGSRTTRDPGCRSRRRRRRRPWALYRRELPGRFHRHGHARHSSRGSERRPLPGAPCDPVINHLPYRRMPFHPPARKRHVSRPAKTA